MTNQIIEYLLTLPTCNSVFISVGTPLAEIGWDSLALVTFIVHVDNVFNVALDIEDITRAVTVGDLILLVEKHVSGLQTR